MQLDPIDHKILEVLRADGRISNADLALRINLSASACHRRVRRLEEEGIIQGYVARISPTATGKATAVFVEITLTNLNDATQQAFEAAVALCEGVVECHLMSGEADYLLRVTARDPADYEHIHKTQLSRLPHVARIRSSFALRPVALGRGPPA